jgi:hypothetical protein
MLALLYAIGMFVADLFKSRSRLEAQNLFLRHQLTLALRQKRPRMRLRGSDRALLVWLVRLWPSLLDAVHVVQPETILRWHRAGVRAFWRLRSRNRAGRPRIDRELRELIRRMSLENALWGASRIHDELLKLGYEVAQSTVSKYMAVHHYERRARRQSPQRDCDLAPRCYRHRPHSSSSRAMTDRLKSFSVCMGRRGSPASSCRPHVIYRRYIFCSSTFGMLLAWRPLTISSSGNGCDDLLGLTLVTFAVFPDYARAPRPAQGSVGSGSLHPGSVTPRSASGKISITFVKITKL